MEMFTAETERVLRAAGWFPGRRVDTSAWRAPLETGGLAMHDAAERFLAEFGGLTFEDGGLGISGAREPFELDPLLCIGEEDRFAGWGGRIGRSLFPLGELDQGRYFLGIDETGEVYLVVDWIGSFGHVPDAIEKLIRGVHVDQIYPAY